MSDHFQEKTNCWLILLITSFATPVVCSMFPQDAQASDPIFVVGAAADIQYEDRLPGPHNDDVRRWYNTAHIRLDEMVRAWNANPEIDFVIHLGDLINAHWESYDAVLDYADGRDYDPNLLTFRDLTMPSYQLVGNHEFYAIDDDPHPLGHDDLHVRERLGLVNNLAYYEFSPAPGFRFVVLDDQVPEANPLRPEDSFGLGERRPRYFDQQMQWARRIVADAWRDGEKVVLFQHYPMSKYYNDKALNTWEAELGSIIETYPNIVAHFSGHFHAGPGKVKDGVLYDTLGGTVSANPELGQNIWYEFDFYDDHVVVDQFGENFYLEPDEDDKIFFFRDHTLAPNCSIDVDCLAVEFTDFNGDGDFDPADLAIWQANYGTTAGVTLELGDAQGDLDIDGSDFLAYQRRVGTGISTVTSAHAVAEPSTAMLLVLISVIALKPRRTSRA